MGMIMGVMGMIMGVMGMIMGVMGMMMGVMGMIMGLMGLIGGMGVAVHPVADDGASLRREHAFGMKLDTVDVVFAVA